MRTIVSTLAAASLLAASTTAAAAPVAPREASPVQSAEQASDNTWIWIGAAIVAGILLFLILDDDDEPESP